LHHDTGHCQLYTGAYSSIWDWAVVGHYHQFFLRDYPPVHKAALIGLKPRNAVNSSRVACFGLTQIWLQFGIFDHNQSRFRRPGVLVLSLTRSYDWEMKTIFSDTFQPFPIPIYTPPRSDRDSGPSFPGLHWSDCFGAVSIFLYRI
jgi:hypothetical protein